MEETLQFDPALRQLLLRKTGSVSGEIPSEEIGAEEIPVVAKLVDPSVPVESLRIVAHFGQVVTARVPLGRIVEVRRHVASLKASRTYQADLAFSVPEIHASSETSNGLIGVEGFTGRGVIIGIVDWGCDFAHVNFRDKEDKSRIHYLWDQRGGRYSESPEPFGYGREFNREQINFALLQPDPYVSLSYDPADADPMGIGTHCTHVMHIAAGNDRAPGSSPGVAPEAEFIVVHLKGEDVRSGGTLGDSVRVLEAVHYIFDKAREFNMPAVVNLSLGKTAGAHDGKTLVEQAFDNLLDEMPGRAIVMSAGNYFDTDMHASGQLKPGEYIDLQWLVAPVNDEITEMDIWYAGSDRFNVELIDPSGQNVARVALADNTAVKNGERIIASIFHRQHDPNNEDNHIVIFLWPDAMLGTWTIRLLGEAVTNGSYHAWIERDNPMFQSRFARDCAVQTSTTGTICNGRKTIAVGAYDAREPSHPLAPFSSAGPTRDNRQKPDIAAPGVGILAARSSQPSDQGPRALNGLTTKSGTSMASPHVAGVIALMYQAAREHRLTIDQTREILIKTVRSESLSGESELERLRYGAGRVNAAAAVKAVLLMKQTEPASQDLSPLALSATLSEEYEEREIGESQLAYPDNAGGADSTDLMSIEKDSEGTMITSRANYEQSKNGTDFAWINRDDASLRSWLALILPCLLVEFGESELQRVNQYGQAIYDRCQPLTFGPTGEQYALTQGKYN